MTVTLPTSQDLIDNDMLNEVRPEFTCWCGKSSRAHFDCFDHIADRFAPFPKTVFWSIDVAWEDGESFGSEVVIKP